MRLEIYAWIIGRKTCLAGIIVKMIYLNGGFIFLSFYCLCVCARRVWRVKVRLEICAWIILRTAGLAGIGLLTPEHPPIQSSFLPPKESPFINHPLHSRGNRVSLHCSNLFAQICCILDLRTALI